jgi:hypothetical protein
VPYLYATPLPLPILILEERVERAERKTRKKESERDPGVLSTVQVLVNIEHRHQRRSARRSLDLDQAASFQRPQGPVLDPPGDSELR